MRPAWSVILFTVVSGVGFGSSFFVGLFVQINTGHEVGLVIALLLLAFVLIAFGLCSSTLHLGHPLRAIKAFSQWRSSWLSREGVFSVLTMLALALLGYLLLLDSYYVRIVGYLVALFSIASIFCTAMIYASLKTVPAWNSVFTPVCYLCFAIVSGWFAVTLFYSYLVYFITGNALIFLLLLLSPNNIVITIVLLIVLWVFKLCWWFRSSNGVTSTISAIGLTNFDSAKLMQPPHSEQNWLQKEMMFQIARKHILKIRILIVVLGLILPILLLCLAFYQGVPFAVLIAFLSFFVSILLERWLFFAEAKHTVSYYYKL